jgi:hypothetical protein
MSIIGHRTLYPADTHRLIGLMYLSRAWTTKIYYVQKGHGQQQCTVFYVLSKGMDNKKYGMYSFPIFLQRAWTTKNMECTVFYVFRKGTDNKKYGKYIYIFFERAWTTKNMECTVLPCSKQGHGQQKICNVQFFSS